MHIPLTKWNTTLQVPSLGVCLWLYNGLSMAMPEKRESIRAARDGLDTFHSERSSRVFGPAPPKAPESIDRTV
ncbi:hypothetical protein CC2G_003942 [Coprinopsis cinerea AmutBmut pab1-1]|nr:hypothetical protein CC2G_003942 [Coprinopsis cinerea AmutBmut pab1-1]